MSRMSSFLSRHGRLISTVACWIVLMTGRGTAAHGGALVDLGGLYDGYSVPLGTTPGGSTVVGESESTAFSWTPNAGMRSLGRWDNGSAYSLARAISADGQWIVGDSQGTEPPWYARGVAFRMRTSGGAMEELPPLETTLWNSASTVAVSRNGAVVVGHSQRLRAPNNPNSGYVTKVVKWIDGGAAIELGGERIGRAFDMSADGAIVVGDYDFSEPTEAFHLSAARWNGVGGPERLMPGCSQAVEVSDDGSIVLLWGWPTISNGGCDTPTHENTSLYRGSGGGLQLLPPETGETGLVSSYFTMSPNGSIVLYDHTIWTQREGGRDIAAYLTSLGADLSGWNSLIVRRVADNEGTIFIGYGEHPPSGQRAWIFNADADGDGILDAWESEGGGIPMPDGSHYDLYAMGARRYRKDIFVEVDAMPGREFLPGAQAKVVHAFDVAPVPAPGGVPGGLPGIALHIVPGGDSVPPRPYNNGMTDLYQDKADYFGTPAERQNPLALEAKRKVFHYAIFADTRASGALGKSEQHGNDISLTLGAFSGGSIDQQAGDFMHELGHNLGLMHGGSDDVVFKPNYFSVMNHTWAQPFPWSQEIYGYGPWEPRYSDGSRGTLREQSLSEPPGIGGTYPLTARVAVPYSIPLGTTSTVSPTGWACTAPYTYECIDYAFFNSPADWNADRDFIDTNLPDMDINSLRYISTNPVPVPGQTLADHNDWASLRYNFRDSENYEDPAVVDLAEGGGDEDELTVDMVLALESFPPPPTCPSIVTTSPPIPQYATLALAFGCAPASATFSVTAGGTNPWYTWSDYPFTTPIPGETGSSVTISNATFDVYRRALATNNCGSASADFYLSVAYEPPTIKSQPGTVVFPEGSEAYFGPVVQPGGLAEWRWTKDGMAAPEWDGYSSIWFEHVTYADAGVYVATTSNGCGSVTSAPITLVVVAANCTDLDGDGYGVQAGVLCAAGTEQDCDDFSPEVHPGAADVTCNGIDDDCDGQMDDGHLGTCLCTEHAAGLTSWWPADGSAEDAPGTNDGSLQDGATYAPGQVGQAFSLDGGGGHVLIPDHPSLDPGAGSFTVAAWIKTSVATTGFILSKYDCGGSCPYGLASSLYDLLLGGGHPIFELRDFNGYSTQYLYGPASIADDAWHHVAGERDMATSAMSLFVDGLRVASSPLSADADGPIVDGDGEADPLFIGALAVPGESSAQLTFTGLIDEAMYFNRALSPAEVRAIHETASGVICRCTDADGDGYGAEDGLSCAAGTARDCDESNAAISPGALELCNGLDDNCDAAIDNGIPAPAGLPAVLGTKLAGDASFAWTAVAGATGYDVVRGGIHALRSSGGNFTSSTTGCVGNDIADLFALDMSTPASGDGTWLLVRAVNACGGSGSYDDGTASQQGSRDAEIAASPAPCP